MPCQSYETNWAHDYDDSKLKKLKQEADKLARIACKAMTALEEMGKEDFLLLQDDEVREWWQAHKEADRKERARVAELERRERIRNEALARLSDEEKELLGLQKPRAKKKTAKATITRSYKEWDVEEATLVDIFRQTYSK